MAQVARGTIEQIELLLDLSLDQWRELPEVVATIDEWDPLDQLTFVVDWPVEEMRLERLEHYAAAGEMTPDQAARFDKLKGLVAKDRPIIERLFAS